MKHLRHMIATPFGKVVVIVALIAVLAMVVEVGLQQRYRQAANDPQIPLAESVARLLTFGVAPATILAGQPTINLRDSIAPWVVIYDAQGAPVASTALIDNAVPHLPMGLFEYVAKHGEDRITWQPAPDVRQAIVIVGAGEKGFAVSGRSLRDVEIAEDSLLKRVVLGWLVLVIAALYWYRVTVRRHRR